MALNQAKEKRLKRNEQARKMRDRRGEEIQEKQRIYAKTHREKLKKERENAMAIEERLKQAASNGAMTHSDSANTQPNEVPDTAPASAGAPHVSEVAEATALLNKAEERRLKEQEQNKNHREKLKKLLEDTMEALKQAASNAAACHTSKELEAPGASKGARDGAGKKRELEASEWESEKQVRDFYEAMGGYGLSKGPSSPTCKSRARTSRTAATW
jgi:hypothetical protein